MGITEIISIISTVVSDAPTLVSLVEKLIPIFKENRAPTDEEWQDLISEMTAANAKLQSDPIATKASS